MDQYFYNISATFLPYFAHFFTLQVSTFKKEMGINIIFVSSYTSLPL